MLQENLDYENIETTIGYIGKLSTKKNDEKLSIMYDLMFIPNTKIKKAA